MPQSLNSQPSGSQSSSQMPPKQLIDRLIQEGNLSAHRADEALTVLGVTPSKRQWHTFFDTALLIIGMLALVLSLVFFVAYNWFYMGKMGKFALVEGALLVSVLAYAYLAYRQQHPLIQQLLLLVASIIVGSLLALFGQVYQTGADTWQLFATWAMLIIPFVLLARLPALWLLWLGLVNAGIFGKLTLSDFGFSLYGVDVARSVVLTLIDGVAVFLWQRWHNLSWSTYMLAMVTTFFASYVGWEAINYPLYLDTGYTWLAKGGMFAVWGGWCGYLYWQFRTRRLDVLMLTVLCVSVISVVMVGLARLVLDDFEAGGFLLMGMALIGMTSWAVMWLRGLVTGEDALTGNDPQTHDLQDTQNTTKIEQTEEASDV